MKNKYSLINTQNLRVLVDNERKKAKKDSMFYDRFNDSLTIADKDMELNAGQKPVLALSFKLGTFATLHYGNRVIEEKLNRLKVMQLPVNVAFESLTNRYTITSIIQE